VNQQVPPKHPVIETSVPLDVYSKLVDECAQNRIYQKFANSCPYHARYVIEKLFEIAHRELFLVTGALTLRSQSGVDIYAHPPVIEKALSYLDDPNVVLPIVIQTGTVDGGDDNVFLRQVIDAPRRNGTVELYIPVPGLLTEKVHHFMMADDIAYRLESKNEPRDRDEPIGAIANFGDAAEATRLHAVFDAIKKRMEPTTSRKIACFKTGIKFKLP